LIDGCDGPDENYQKVVVEIDCLAPDPALAVKWAEEVRSISSYPYEVLVEGQHVQFRRMRFVSIAYELPELLTFLSKKGCQNIEYRLIDAADDGPE